MINFAPDAQRTGVGTGAAAAKSAAKLEAATVSVASKAIEDHFFAAERDWNTEQDFTKVVAHIRAASKIVCDSYEKFDVSQVKNLKDTFQKQALNIIVEFGTSASPELLQQLVLEVGVLKKQQFKARPLGGR